MSGKKAKPIILIDTSVFLAWLNKEENKPLDLIEAVLDQVDKGLVTSLVSTITDVEILNTSKCETARSLIGQYFRKSSVTLISPIPPVTDTAVKIRQASLELNDRPTDKYPKLRTPDAIVMATAVIFKAEALLSFDPDMTRFDGHSIVSGLRICRPYGFIKDAEFVGPPLIDQRELDFGS